MFLVSSIIRAALFSEPWALHIQLLHLVPETCVYASSPLCSKPIDPLSFINSCQSTCVYVLVL